MQELLKKMLHDKIESTYQWGMSRDDADLAAAQLNNLRLDQDLILELINDYLAADEDAFNDYSPILHHWYLDLLESQAKLDISDDVLGKIAKLADIFPVGLTPMYVAEFLQRVHEYREQQGQSASSTFDDMWKPLIEEHADALHFGVMATETLTLLIDLLSQSNSPDGILESLKRFLNAVRAINKPTVATSLENTIRTRASKFGNPLDAKLLNIL